MALSTILLLAALALIASGPELLGRLAGRLRAYLAAQLQQWRAGSSKHEPR